MSKFYFITLNVLPIFISSTEILNNFLNSLILQEMYYIMRLNHEYIVKEVYIAGPPGG